MEYKHFSHEHALTLHKVEPHQHFQCHACHSPCGDSIFACWKCNFFLHENCGNAKRHIKNGFHSEHPLVLLPSPTYCGGMFLCDICGEQGSTFSYCCVLCEFDLHVHCAHLPSKIKHDCHEHELNIFRLRSADRICEICNKELKSGHCAYFCYGCSVSRDFYVHTYCAVKEVKPEMHKDNLLGDKIDNVSVRDQI